MKNILKLSFIASATLVAFSANAAEVQVAVAANFTAPMKDIAVMYEKATGDKILASYDSTGKFYAQIKNGAPYQVLFAADAKTPAKIEAEGLGVKGTAKPYAFGKLVLWSATPDFVKEDKNFILSDAVKKIAVANPKLAPYGEAAYQTMTSWKNIERAKEKFVEGDNIGNTYNYAATGNAQVGFVALSQVIDPKTSKFAKGSGWIIPSNLYSPIRQDSVVLNPGKDNAAVEKFMKYMATSPDVKKLIESYGYGLE